MDWAGVLIVEDVLKDSLYNVFNCSHSVYEQNIRKMGLMGRKKIVMSEFSIMLKSAPNLYHFKHLQFF